MPRRSGDRSGAFAARLGPGGGFSQGILPGLHRWGVVPSLSLDSTLPPLPPLRLDSAPLPRLRRQPQLLLRRRHRAAPAPPSPESVALHPPPADPTLSQDLVQPDWRQAISLKKAIEYKIGKVLSVEAMLWRQYWQRQCLN